MKDVDKKLADIIAAQPAVTIGFSLGKDSLCCTQVCRDLGVKTIYPFYFYHIPGLQFVEDSIKLYEDLFGFKVIQLPHPMTLDTVRRQDWQSYRMVVWLNGFDWVHVSFEELVRAYFDDVGLDEGQDYYDVVGMRAAESFNRRKVFEKMGPVYMKHGQNKIFPIWNWKKADVMDYLAARRIPLSKDYAIWDRSWDGLKYQFLYGVKRNYPKDYELIREYFPLIDAECLRYDLNKTYFK